MVKIALDAGHGINTPGKRSPADEREWTFNDKVLRVCISRLNQYRDVQILRLDDPTGKTDVPLTARVKKANNWRADVLVSIHHNAYQSKWGNHGGVETLIANNASKASGELAKLINPKIVRAMGLRNRGVKRYDWYIVRYSNMPAILTEGGFMDSTTDIGALRDDNKLRAQGYAIADGLAEYFKLQLIQSQATTVQQTEKEVDNMVGFLNAVGRTEIRELLKKARENGVIDAKFHTDEKIASYTDAELLSYQAAVINRTFK